MSVFFGVRLTEELAAKIEADGRGKTAVIVAALEAYFEISAITDTTQPLPSKIQPTQPWPRPDRALHTDAVATTGCKATVAHQVPGVTTAAKLPTPSRRTICPRCDGKLTPWGPQMHCGNCNQNWPATL